MSEKPQPAPQEDKPKADSTGENSFYVPEYGVNVRAKTPEEAIKKAAALSKQDKKEDK